MGIYKLTATYVGTKAINISAFDAKKMSGL